MIDRDSFKKLKEFGLNPWDWQINFTYQPKAPFLRADLINTSDPEFKIRAHCTPKNKKGKLVFEWMDLHLC